MSPQYFAWYIHQGQVAKPHHIQEEFLDIVYRLAQAASIVREPEPQAGGAAYLAVQTTVHEHHTICEVWVLPHTLVLTFTVGW